MDDKRLREARRRLALVQGCLECNAEDERVWRFIIEFLEEAK